MNIPNKFDLFFENKLTDKEKIEFEKDLLEQPELRQLYLEYVQINRITDNELYSEMLFDNDPLLNELSISQRLDIESDFIRFHDKNGKKTGESLKFPGKEKPYDQDDYPSDHPEAVSEPEELRFNKVRDETSLNKPSRKPNSVFIYLGVAATVTLAIFAGKSIIDAHSSRANSISPQQAFNDYYKPAEDETLRSVNFSDARLRAAFFELKRSNFDSGIIFSNQMEVSKEDYELSLLYLGIINIERENLEEARGCFLRILSFEGSEQRFSASFYLSLVYLAEENINEAKPILLKLSESKNPYRKNARTVLKSLKLQ